MIELYTAASLSSLVRMALRYKQQARWMGVASHVVARLLVNAVSCPASTRPSFSRKLVKTIERTFFKLAFSMALKSLVDVFMYGSEMVLGGKLTAFGFIFDLFDKAQFAFDLCGGADVVVFHALLSC